VAILLTMDLSRSSTSYTQADNGAAASTGNYRPRKPEHQLTARALLLKASRQSA
jgi:hypothetical protein